MAGSHNYAERAIEYCRRVLDGDISACRWIKLACKRHLDDLERWPDKSGPFWFSEARANHVCLFIEQLSHTKGEWASRQEKLKLELWQCFILCVAFGWLTQEGYRRFRTVLTLIPRKNAKSTLTAGVGLYGLTCDKEAGAEIYSAATTRSQARILFSDAQLMANRVPQLRKAGVEVSAHTIEQGNNVFRPLSADGKTLDGLNVHYGLIDEYHAHPTREVVNVIETGMGSRTQPLLWIITTAGVNKHGPCYAEQQYAQDVLNGVVDDPRYLAFLYTIDPEDIEHWDQEWVWQKANPNYGVSVRKDYLESKVVKARQMPTFKTEFFIKHLDVWSQSVSPWINIDVWNRNNEVWSEEELQKADLFMAADLATVNDLAALACLFRLQLSEADVDGKPRYKYFVKCQAYACQHAINLGPNAAHYRQWESEDLLIQSGAMSTDFESITDDILLYAKKYKLVEVGVDPYQSQAIKSVLEKHRISVIDIPQTTNHISPAMKEVERCALDGSLTHDGNKVLQWAVGNVKAFRDRRDNVTPYKDKDEAKIDPAVAVIMAMSRAMVYTKKGSVYERRGVRVLG